MASKKRPLPLPEEEEEEEEGEASRRLKRWRPLVREVMGELFMRRFLAKAESVLRSAVQEEVRKLFASCALPIPSQEVEVRYQLQFQNDLPEKLYTFSKIITKDKNPVQISIIDTTVGKIVTSGSLSSVKIEVLVLHSDFCVDGQVSWTKEEFNNHIVVAREGKGKLLMGKQVIQLADGVGYLDDITFTDNSVWTRSQKFRLAVRSYKNGGVQEGISEPFRVKDRRGKSYEKHHPPSLTDDVWCLEKIRKGGPFHQRLTGAGIHNVQQLLQALSIDHDNLRNLLGNGGSIKKGIPNKTWEAIVANARECRPGNGLYSYNVVEQSVTLIFNLVFELLGAKLDGQYQTISDLNAPQKALVENWKRLAFEDQDGFNLDHMMVDNIPVPLPREYDNLVTASSSFGSQCPHFSGEASRRVTLPNEPFAPYGELPNNLPQQQDTFAEQGVHPFKKSTCSQEADNSCSTKEKWRELRISKEIRVDHVIVDNFCQTIPPTNGTSFPGSNSVDLENCYFSDESTRHAGLLHQPFTFGNELSSNLLELQGTITEPEVSSVQESASLQVLNDIQSPLPKSLSLLNTPCSLRPRVHRARGKVNSRGRRRVSPFRTQFVSTETSDVLVNNFSMSLPTANGVTVPQSSIPDIHIPGYQAIENDQPVLQVDSEKFFQESSIQQSTQSCQSQATMFNSIDIVTEHIFQNEPSAGRLVGHILKDDEIGAFILENMGHDITRTIIATSTRKWVKLIAVAQVWNLYQRVSNCQKIWNGASENPNGQCV